MIKYRKWREIRIYDFLNGTTPFKTPKEIISDGWYLFGKIPLYTRENI